MGDVTDLPDRKKARAAKGTDAISILRDAATGADPRTIADEMEAARMTVDDIANNIKLVAGILEVFALDCGEPHRVVTDEAIDRQWLQVEYVARQIMQHVKELEDAMLGVEHGVMAVSRVARASTPAAPDEEGGAA